ncbi:MAG: hypothetical protein AB1522_10515 [Chloroflexota bacterium]
MSPRTERHWHRTAFGAVQVGVSRPASATAGREIATPPDGGSQ